MPDNEVKPPPIAAGSSADRPFADPVIIGRFIWGLVGLVGFLLVLIVAALDYLTVAISHQYLLL